ncbi:MAG TPA: methyltransferase domain-containing protein [Chloroflexota bacterium]|nr:methyltransferase domain-containing protein [Chloroflexota bacterium]
MTHVFALTTRGLESTSAREIAALPGVTVTQVAYRRVAAACAGPLEPLLGLRTVDDVFLDVATWHGIGRPRRALATLRALSTRIDLHAASRACAGLRPLRTPPTFAVTASFVGKRNYSTAEIKHEVAVGVEAGHGWTYCRDDAAADLTIRLFIEHDVAFVGVRLGKTALSKRPYKQVHLPGSLKPPVAAALVMLVDGAPGLRLLDPCCGAGTILVEAALGGAVVLGGDSDPAAVAAARGNVEAAGVRAEIQQWDAQALPIAGASIDRIVSNLPWGRQVAVDAALATFYRRTCSEMRRVLTPSGRIALLTSTPHLLDLLDVRCEKEIQISLFGQTPTIIIAVS